MQVAEAMAGNTVIFDNGAPDQLNGGEVTQYVESEDFMVERPGILTDCHFWTMEGYGIWGGNPWDGTLEYWIFANNGGWPGGIIDSGSGQNIVRTATGGPSWFAYDFDMERPVPLVADNTYWLGLHLASDYNDRDEIYWETTTVGWGAIGKDSLGGTFDNWSNVGNYAFYLTTPEPATICLLGLGALSLLRRKTRA
jgi:hypothetical protein